MNRCETPKDIDDTLFRVPVFGKDFSCFFFVFFLQSACVVQLAMFYRFCDKNNSIYIYCI